MFPAHPRESNTEADRKNLEPQLGPYIHHKWHTDTIYEIDLVKVQDMGLKFYQIFSYAVVHFGDVPAECIARVVAYDENDFERKFHFAIS